MAGLRGEYKKSAERRQQILDAAFAVFSRTGYSAASVNDIAREVNMSQTGVVHHFRGKTELLRAVLERRDSVAEQILGGRRGIEWLRGLLEISQLQTTQRGVVQMYTILAAEATNPDHPAHSYFTERFARVAGFTTLAFAQAKEDGHVRSDVEPRRAALSTIAITEGVETLWLNGLEVDIVDDVRQHIQQYLTVPL